MVIERDSEGNFENIEHKVFGKTQLNKLRKLEWIA